MTRGLHSRGAIRTAEVQKPAPARDTVVCPGCGGPARDAVLGRPRWTCLRGSCVFAYGWKLDFAEPLVYPSGDDDAEAQKGEPPNRAMIAVPYGYKGDLCRDDAVIWPRPEE